MDWWKYVPQSELCNSTNKLFEEWVQRANAVSLICGFQDGIGIVIRNGHVINELRKHCGNQQIADFAWLTLRFSHIFTCYNSTDEHLLSVDQGWNQASIWFKQAITVFFVIVFVVGLIGNFLTVTVIYHTPTLQTHTNYFLASLATSDFFLIIFGIPYDLIYLWKKSTPPNLPGITVNQFTMVSILTIMALAAERFFAICHPFTLLYIGKQRVIQFIYTIWIAALFPSLYIGLQFKQVTADFCGYKRVLEDGTGRCDYVGTTILPFSITFETNFTITFVVPVVFIVYCYVRILRALSEMSHVTVTQIPLNSNSNANVGDASTYTQNTNPPKLCLHMKGNEPLRSQQAHKVVIKILVVSTATFFISYLPYHVERFIVYYKRKQCDDSHLCQILYSVTGLLLYFSAMLNPVFYNIMSLRFREAFLRWIKTTFSNKRYDSITV
uniref:G_PROTEIN_RECEP_F1_2 domain-containing protein n=1 Tax=Syphacia muris TaxID=451379 RepID=A0A0N5AB47_9BILA